MAFATSNIVRRNRGDLSVVAGNWTASVGDAAGTVALGSAAVSADFFANVSTGPYQGRIPVSGLGTTTVTVYHQSAVTNGYFEIAFRG